jgi:hypothetical protein
MTTMPFKSDGDTKECIHEKLVRIKIYAVEIAEMILFLTFVLVWLAREIKSLF